jgi:lipoprotein-anchoring transpeptidase ErfK/SrfK
MSIGGSQSGSDSAQGSAGSAGHRSLRRTLLERAFAAVLIVLSAIPIIVGVTLTSGAASAARSASTVAVKIHAPPSPGPAAAPLPAGSGALVAGILHPTEMRAAPAGKTIGRLSTRTNFGSPAFLWVVDHTPGWLGVISSLAGNGRVGWIPQSDASLTRVPFEVRVSLSAHRLMVLDNGRVLKQYPVAVGKPSSPTPTGRFAVTDRLLTGDPQGAYGCCILALSAMAPHAIADWSGGNRVAIHSTPETASIGNSVTHGCVRVDLADGRWLLNHVPLGTPTLISS